MGTEAERSFNENIDCGVISLKRTPQRLARFLEQNSPTGIRFQILEAVDGSALSDAELKRPDVIRPGTSDYSRGAIGNALSHRALWEQAIAKQRPMFVLEDDAFVRRDIRSVLPALLSRLGNNWDFLTVACNTDSVVHVDYVAGTDAIIHFTVPNLTEAGLQAFVKQTNPVSTHRLRNSFGTCGYVVSPKGAAWLKATVFPLDNRVIQVQGLRRATRANGFDLMMNSVYRNINAYACIPPLVLSQNLKGERTI